MSLQTLKNRQIPSGISLFKSMNLIAAPQLEINEANDDAIYRAEFKSKSF